MIETTEALTSIDVNSGRFNGAQGLEQTALRTNREAAKEAARQIRLRNISGLIVIDFIQMEVDENWAEIVYLLNGLVARDRNLTRVLGVTKAGLVEVTRRRRREPLLYFLTEICGDCEGTGRRKSIYALSTEILRALRVEAKTTFPGEVFLHAAEDVVYLLENQFSIFVDDIKADTGRTINLRSNHDYELENYDIFVG